MAEMYEHKEPDDSEEETFGDQRLAERRPRLLHSLRSLPAEVAQKQMQSNLEEILQRLTRMNATLGLGTQTQLQTVSKELAEARSKLLEQESALKELSERVTRSLAEAGRDRENIRTELFRALEQARLGNSSSCKECPESWLPFQGSCYFFSTLRATWVEAQQHCERSGAHLVIVGGLEEQGFLSRNTRGRGYWLGLRAVRKVRRIQGYQWVDGVALSFSHWNRGEPNDSMGREDCIMMLRTGMWNDAPCNNENDNWISAQMMQDMERIQTEQKRMESQESELSWNLDGLRADLSDLKSRGSVCDTCPEAWIYFQKKCYYFGEGAKKWIQARYACEDLDGRLVSIHSPEEQDFLTKRANWRGSWIGLRDLDIEGEFIWMDNQPLDYSNWQPGEPNDGGQGENCVMMLGSGKWNDAFCGSDLHGWVCDRLATC
ncbi:hypothetical protein MG293_008757 [Ovis ammon polii]|uniref:C-type lectin domain-containing protein n=1 Tax=Ovis ammon polii TaxID=230172 RepID=A0AAD4Y8A9_OVIAM|nr:hypothetical protein MG293_008757 [Ovis ammon polii]